MTDEAEERGGWQDPAMDEHSGSMAEDVAYDLGQRLRTARYRAHRTLAEVAEETGVSTSTLSRMELGHGGSTPLGNWVLVASSFGVDLLQPPAEGVDELVAAIEHLIADAEWTPIARDGAYVWFDRPPRRNPWLPHSVRPAQRIVLGVVPLLTDQRMAFERLRVRLRETRRSGPPGVDIGGLLVVRRTTNNLRRASPQDRRRSHGPWMAALRSKDGRLPVSQGLVWMSARATHLQGVT